MAGPTGQPVPEPFAGTGEVATLLRAHDWSRSPLGPPERWPRSLRTIIGIVLASGHPMAISWGPDYALLYNDAYRPFLGTTKHPRALGLPSREVFPETWAEVGPTFDKVTKEGIEVSARDRRYLLERNGYREERYFDFASSPIRDESGAVGGVLSICTETTARVLNERRMYHLFEMAPAAIAILRGPEFRFEYTNPAYRLLLGPRELIGRPLREAIPDIEPFFIELLERVYAGGEPFVGTEMPARWLRDGEPQEGYFNFTYQPMRDSSGKVDSIAVHGVDVTVQVRARRAVEATERRLATILEQLPVGVVIAEAPSGRIVQGNAQVEAILRHPILPSPTVADYGDWIGFREDGGRIHAEEWPLARAIRGETVLGAEYRYQRGDGTTTWIRINGAPIRDGSGRIVAGVVTVTDIAERRVAEGSLRESEARLQQALKAGGLGPWRFDMVADVFDASDDCKANLGLPVGAELRYDDFLALLHPEDREGVRAAIASAIVERRDYAADYRIRAPDGSIRWIAAHGRTTYAPDDSPLAIIGTTQDVTERKRTEEELRDARRRLEATLDAAEIATWIWDIPNDRVVADRNLARFFGVSPEEANGGPLDRYIDAVHPDDRQHVSAVVSHAIASGNSYEAEYRLLRADGTIRWVAARGRVERDAKGRARHLPGVVLDITARKRAEEGREGLLAAERAARTEAEEAVRARDTFLSIAAHELRTPVTALKGTAQLLLRWQARGQMEPTRLTRNLDVLSRSADRLAELTDDLLDVSRIRTGQLSLDPQPTDLAALVTEAVARQREQAADPHNFVMVFGEQLPPVLADAGRIEQVLTNLLSNAVKYSPEGGEITTTLNGDDRGVFVRVRDAGIGLPDGAAEAIFAPFGRATNVATTNLPGMGLGLYICRTIIERHGGWISAESAGEGRGTTVTFWLPREAPLG